jgi:hypothetical protein
MEGKSSVPSERRLRLHVCHHAPRSSFAPWLRLVKSPNWRKLSLGSGAIWRIPGEIAQDPSWKW